MKKHPLLLMATILATIIFCPHRTVAQTLTPGIEWESDFGLQHIPVYPPPPSPTMGDSAEEWLFDVIQTTDGNYLSVGYAEPGDEKEPIAILKDPYGKTLWYHTYTDAVSGTNANDKGGRFWSVVEVNDARGHFFVAAGDKFINCSGTDLLKPMVVAFDPYGRVLNGLKYNGVTFAGPFTFDPASANSNSFAYQNQIIKAIPLKDGGGFVVSCTKEWKNSGKSEGDYCLIFYDNSLTYSSDVTHSLAYPTASHGYHRPRGFSLLYKNGSNWDGSSTNNSQLDGFILTGERADNFAGTPDRDIYTVLFDNLGNFLAEDVQDATTASFSLLSSIDDFPANANSSLSTSSFNSIQDMGRWVGQPNTTGKLFVKADCGLIGKPVCQPDFNNRLTNAAVPSAAWQYDGITGYSINWPGFHVANVSGPVTLLNNIPAYFRFQNDFLLEYSYSITYITTGGAAIAGSLSLLNNSHFSNSSGSDYGYVGAFTQDGKIIFPLNTASTTTTSTGNLSNLCSTTDLVDFKLVKVDQTGSVTWSKIFSSTQWGDRKTFPHLFPTAAVPGKANINCAWAVKPTFDGGLIMVGNNDVADDNGVFIKLHGDNASAGDALCEAATDPVYHRLLTNEITAHTTLSGKIYIPDNTTVNVADGVMLDITNVDMVFGYNSGISFGENCVLIANNSVFRPCITGVYAGNHVIWNGFTFSKTARGEINGCIFRNATDAIKINFQTSVSGTPDLGILGCQFVNCKNSIHIFNGSILGSVLDYKGTINNNVFSVNQVDIGHSNPYIAIQLTLIRMTELISQNNFIYTEKTKNAIQFFGIISNSSSAIVSKNKFTNMYRGVDAEFTPTGTSFTIENNEFDVNQGQGDHAMYSHMVNVSNNIVPVLVEGNKFHSAVDAYSNDTRQAIYTEASSSLDIRGNIIYGFQYGVYILNSSSGTGSIQVTSNLIENVKLVGIHSVNSSNVIITCNTIKCGRQQSDQSFGVFGIKIDENVQSDVEVFGNCIFDASTAIDLHTVGASTDILPQIKNNFLYNYYHQGIYNHDFTAGSIGASGGGYLPTGRNSFVSNNYNTSGANDIQSDPPFWTLSEYGNFGIHRVNATVALGSTVGVDDFPSTASCSQTIDPVSRSTGNEPESDNANFCGFALTQRIYPLILVSSEPVQIANSGDSFSLSQNEADYGTDLAKATEIAGIYVIRHENLKLKNLNQKLIGFFKGNDELWYNYTLCQMLGNHTQALEILNIIRPLCQDEKDRICIEKIQFWLSDSNRTVNQLDNNQLLSLEQIDSRKDARFAGAARLILRTRYSFLDYDFKLPPAHPIHKIPSEDQTISLTSNYLTLRPNPAEDFAYAKFHISNKIGAKLSVTDICGKNILSFPVLNTAEEVKFDIKCLSGGIYIISISNDNGEIQKAKLIKP